MTYAQVNAVLLIADPKILAVKIIENHEPMVNLTQQNIIAYGESPEIPNNTDYTQMRKKIYEKLVAAQKLLPKGVHFRIWEAYRSLHTQEMIFQGRYKIVRALYPTWTKDAVFTETTRLVSPVINLDGSKNIPPHSTGGTVDIYLIDDKGNPLEMGLHPRDWMTKDNDGSRSLTASTVISQTAQANRKIMNQALEAVGFINYQGEYWHWSYGDRYWAYFTKQPFAIYGTYSPV
jgi:D-alanyl-D-alanine dipeptidase